GRENFYQWSALWLKAGDGYRTFSVDREIADPREAERLIARPEERFRLPFDGTGDGVGICEVDPATGAERLVFCNDRYADMAGRPAEELLGAEDRNDFLVRQGSEEARRQWEARSLRGLACSGVSSWKRPDGRDNLQEWSAIRLEGRGKIHLFAVRREVEEPERAERLLRGQEEPFCFPFDAVSDGLHIREPAPDRRRLIFCNDRFVEMSGYTREELVNAADLQELTINRTPEEATRRWHERALQGLPFRGVSSWKRPDGRENYSEWSETHVKVGDRRQAFSVWRGVTERRQAEQKLRLALKELERSNKDLEQFAHVASHDLREPLRMVRSYLELLSRRYEGELGEDADEFIRYARDGAARMQALIDGLLAYSRVGSRGGEFGPVDLEQLQEDVLGNLKLAVEESGAVVTRDELPTVRADGPQLGQLLQNLIENSIKFRRRAALRVHVSAERADGEWTVSLRDNGIGIEPEYVERIFGIFERLHGREEYPGTGVGLAVCRRIVERHNGRIWVESEPGRGSTFRFTLPCEGGEGS
ncbi:MAG: sensor histidine kinase, partial [Planctomycetota bacterium]